MQKRIYNFEKIRGVDVTSSPINVSPNRASRMVNMINDCGVNKKRHGWRDIAWFMDEEGNRLRINGIYKYPQSGGFEETIVHAGEHLYRCGSNFQKSPAFAEIGTVPNEKSKGYVQGGKLWIVCGGEYLVYDGDIIQPVMNSMYAYIPTTSIGILPVFSPWGYQYQGERFQGVNLFNRRRINKLIGQRFISWYTLDGIIDIDCPIKICIEYNRSDEETVKQYTRFEAEYNSEGKKISAVDEDGNEIDGLAEILEEKITFSENRVRIEPSFLPLIEGESNISIEFSAKYENEVELSASNTVSLAAGVDALCLVNHGNVVYFSDVLYGFGYFPDNDYIGIGGEDKAVTAMVSLDNGGIGIFKGDELYRVHVGVKYIDEKYVVRLEPSLVAMIYGAGCENEFCACQVNGDSLIFNGQGVHGLTASTEKPSNLRSTNVNKELYGYSQDIRKEAFAISFEGRYYLFIGGKVYIADTRFKTYESNRLDSSFEYEWWIWDNCECRCAYAFDEKIYMGTENGEIREFFDGYRDEERVRVSTGEVLYDGISFTFNKELKLQDGEHVKIEGAFEKINTKPLLNIEINEQEIVCCYLDEEDYSHNGPEFVFVGMEISLFCNETGKRVTGDVVFNDAEFRCIAFKRYFGDDYNPNYTYDLVKVPGVYTAQSNAGNFDLINEEGRAIALVGYENLSACIHRTRNVACEMVTGVIDFYKLHSKTLYKLAFTPAEDTKGEITIGYETNLKKTDGVRTVGVGFDFADFDFKNFIFDGNFAKTFVKRVFERNFNYIRFRFASDSDGPFGLENAQAIYSVNNELRSDR